MEYRSGLDIKILILAAALERDISLKMLERRVQAGSRTIKKHVRELEGLGLLTTARRENNDQNGRPFTTVQLTTLGHEVLHHLSTTDDK